MPSWLTYEPQDFLLYSPRVYYRLIELHNTALWPFQLAALALGILLIVLSLRREVWAARAVFIILGIVWIWIAWSFLWERYSTINWAAAYIVPLFVLQGLALIGYGALRTDLRFAPVAGFAGVGAILLLAAAIFAYPLIAPFLGRPWSGAELFGIFPDPTAIATLVVLARVRRGGALLMVLPALSCALASEILWLLGSPDFFIPAAAAFAAILLRLARRGETLP